MEWYLALLIIIGGFIIIALAGAPVAIAFLILNIITALIFWGGQAGLIQLSYALFSSVSSFTLVPLPLFILMGEILFHSGIAMYMVDAVDSLLGRLPGRLGLVAVGMGTLLSVLSGSGQSTAAVMGTLLTPEMEKRGYKKAMSIGPILGSCGLAVLIPPSGLSVLIGAVGGISIVGILIGGIFPGLIVATFYALYIILRCWLQPSIAPAYDVVPVPITRKLLLFVRYVMPLAIVVFLVIGVIFLGIATPSEAAALGCIGSLILVAIYGKLRWKVVKESLRGTVNVTIMILFIVAGASIFTQILSFSGASRGLIELVKNLQASVVVTIIFMELIVIFLGFFMSALPIILLIMPIYMPIVRELGIDPVWFAVITLLCVEMAGSTPPFGVYLFVMKAVAPPDTTMGDIWRAGIPFLLCDVTTLALLLAFPAIVTWLPGIIK